MCIEDTSITLFIVDIFTNELTKRRTSSEILAFLATYQPWINSGVSK